MDEKYTVVVYRYAYEKGAIGNMRRLSRCELSYMFIKKTINVST